MSPVQLNATWNAWRRAKAGRALESLAEEGGPEVLVNDGSDEGVDAAGTSGGSVSSSGQGSGAGQIGSAERLPSGQMGRYEVSTPGKQQASPGGTVKSPGSPRMGPSNVPSEAYHQWEK